MAEAVAETARLRLRRWGQGDEQRFYDVMNTPGTMRWLGGVQTPEQWQAACQRIAGFQRDFGHTFWIVEEKATGDILGFCGLKRVNSPGGETLHGEFEVGWRLREDAWGQGIAKEAAIASLDLAFGRYGAPHVVAITVRGNVASQGLMERLGMQRRPDLDFIDTRFDDPGELNPSVLWRIEAEDWPAARERALAPR